MVIIIPIKRITEIINGICIYTTTSSEDQAIISFDFFNFIENNILLNKALINSFMNKPTSVGVFQINDTSLEFEEWQNGYDVITFSNFCNILNDTTFFRTKYIENQSGTEYSKKLLFHFKKFNPKPDSICKFIK